MCELPVLVSALAVLVAIRALKAVTAVVLTVLFGLGAVTHPERCQQAETDADEQADKALRDRADTPRESPPGLRGCWMSFTT